MLVSIIAPCFNEAENIRAFYERVKLSCKDFDHEIVMVNDGSTDSTLQAMLEIRESDPAVRIVSFLKNCGHQAALRAGFRHARGDFVVTLDADLQHPPEKIPTMLQRAQEGNDVIVMVHDEPQQGFFKNFFSRSFYRVFSLLSGVKIDHRASDFRLVSRRVVDIINGLPEHNLFFRALIPHLGFPVHYENYPLGSRYRGAPGYTLRKSMMLAVDALFAFSTLPIRILFLAGLVIAILAFGYGIVNVGFKLFTDLNVPGYTDIVASVLFLGGLNLVMLSVIGKYLQVLLDHIKQRPEYLIDTSRSDPPKP